MEVEVLKAIARETSFNAVSPREGEAEIIECKAGFLPCAGESGRVSHPGWTNIDSESFWYRPKRYWIPKRRKKLDLP
jgi:hypothetical protein